MRVDSWPYEVDEEFKGSGTGFLPVTATVRRVFNNFENPGYSFEEDENKNKNGYTGLIWNVQGKARLGDDGNFLGYDKYEGPTFDEGAVVQVSLVLRGDKGRVKKMESANTEIDNSIIVDKETKPITNEVPKSTPSPGTTKLTTDVSIKKAQSLNLLLQFLTSEQGKSDSALIKANKIQNITQLRKDFWNGFYALKKGETPFADYTEDKPLIDPDEAFPDGGWTPDAT